MKLHHLAAASFIALSFPVNADDLKTVSISMSYGFCTQERTPIDVEVEVVATRKLNEREKTALTETILTGDRTMMTLLMEMHQRADTPTEQGKHFGNHISMMMKTVYGIDVPVNVQIQMTPNTQTFCSRATPSLNDTRHQQRIKLVFV